jgi:hypothetical protein
MLTILSLKPISLYNYHIHKNIFYILKKSNFIQLFTSFYYKAPNVIRTLSTKGHPSYYARFQMHRDDKILVYCPPQNRPPLLYEHFFIAENSLDVNIILLLKIT